MKIAITLNACGNTELVIDTVDAAIKYASKDILMIYDAASVEWGSEVQLPIPKVAGFYHNYFRSPYRNMTLGLLKTINLYPDVDWYCYMEPDVLFASSGFKEDLEKLDSDVWCIGNDRRIGKIKFHLLEAIFNLQMEKNVSLLGCCVFFRAEFIHRLLEMDFFEKLLKFTNDFQSGFFPDCNMRKVYCFGEHLYPTLACKLGGKVEQFAWWSDRFRLWRGNFRSYPMRGGPQLDPQKEDYKEAVIMHPLKAHDHPIRETRRLERHAGR